MKPLTALELIENFDRLPDDAVVPSKVTDIVLGISEWTRRRHPLLRRIPLSPRRFGNRVGDIRAIARGQQTAP
jgi:hypothetical protein